MSLNKFHLQTPENMSPLAGGKENIVGAPIQATQLVRSHK